MSERGQDLTRPSTPSGSSTPRPPSASPRRRSRGPRAPERIGDDARGRMLVAEAAIDLSAARGVIARAAGLVDDHYAAHPDDDGPEDAITAVFAEGQAAKTFVNEAATRVL